MPPTGTTQTDTIRYLTKLLAAFVRQSGGELRIKNKFIREVSDETSRQALFEDTDAKRDELVLRFGSKHSAIYPVEPECQSPPQPVTTSKPTSPVLNSPENPFRKGTVPLDDAAIARMERGLKRVKVAAALQREAKQQTLYSPSDGNL